MSRVYYGQFDPPVDQVLYERYFRDYTNGFFVECGAFDGLTECSCRFFEENLNWQGINIEASPVIFEQLIRNRPHARNLQLALSDYSGTLVFHQAIHPALGELFGNGSLQHTAEHLANLQGQGCSFKAYPVRATTWRELIQQESIRSVDLFVLDVEGSELQVIKGMQNCPVLPKIMCVEHGQIGLDCLLRPLTELGYRYDFSLFVNSFFQLEQK